jgi:hypothetical protein
MNEKKNIDRLFQEKFKDFEVAPNDAVWNRISESLPNKKKKRRVIPIWWQVGGVAAAILLLVTVGVSIFNSDADPSTLPIIVDTEKNNSDSNQNTTKEDKILNDTNSVEKLEFVGSENTLEQNEDSNEEETTQNSNTSNQLIQNPKSQLKSVVTYYKNKDNGQKTTKSESSNPLTTINNTSKDSDVALNTKNKEGNSNNNKSELRKDSELKSTIKKTIEEGNTAVTDNSNIQNNTETSDSDNNQKETEIIKEDPKKESLYDAIADTNKEDDIDEKEKEVKPNRWSIRPHVAPVYYSSLGNGSSLDQQFADNTKSGDINMSYGIAGSYAVSNKLKVRAGVNLVNVNQTTSGVLAVTNPNPAASVAFTSVGGSTPQKYQNITLNSKTQSLSLMSTSSMVASADLSSYKVGSIDQRIGFIEVPLEVEYALLDKKFGINVIGGFSTFFLNNNELYAELDGVSTLIGEANNINSTSFSANFGLGLDYNLSKQWNINLEPQFKYQLNTFNNTSGDFRPFFIGVYTGISFKF